MGTKGPKAGNIYSSLKSRGLIGGKGKDPMLNCGSPFKQTEDQRKTFGPGGSDENPEIYSAIVKEDNKPANTPLKQTKDGSDASVFGSVKRGAQNAVKAYNNTVLNVADKIAQGFGHGNRHMNGPAPSQPSQPSKQSYSAKKSKSKTPQQSYSAVGKSKPKTPLLKKSCKY
jgi:hypothetical protein